MGRNKRDMERIIRFLQAGPRDGEAILQHLNSVSKFGSTMSSLNNLLGKNPDLFVKIAVGRNLSHGWKTAIWALAAESEVI